MYRLVIVLPIALGLGAVGTATLRPPASAAARSLAEESSQTPDTSDRKPVSSQPASEKQREEILHWLDQYLTKEILFRKEDLDKLRAKVAQMSPADLRRWLDQTKQIRDELSSPEWRSTRIWLEGYLPERFYSDEQIEEFRADVGRMSPSELHELLRRIKQKHETVQSVYTAVYASSVRQQQAAVAAKQQQASRVNWTNDYLQRQDASRQKAAARQSQWRSSRPQFGGVQSHAVQRHQQSRRYNQPVVTSEQAARAAVWSGVYGRRW